MSIRYDRHAVKRLRLERALSAEELARRARLTKQAIYSIERGGVPMASTLGKLAHGLAVSVEAFYIRRDQVAA